MNVKTIKGNSPGEIKFFDTIGVHYPFQIERENREPKMCNPIGYDKEKKPWNARMAGFYTCGEYGKGLNGKHEFHSTTCSWVALKERYWER